MLYKKLLLITFALMGSWMSDFRIQVKYDEQMEH